MLLRILPGDPAIRIAGIDASKEGVHLLQKKLGVSRSIWSQYNEWIYNVLLYFDWGKSLFSGEEVKSLIKERLPYSLVLTFVSWICSIIFSFFLVLLTYFYRKTMVAVEVYEVLLHSTPRVLIALSISYVLSIHWHIVPLWGSVKDSLIIPIITLALSNAAILARMLRLTVEEELHAPYVRTARAFGAGHSVILLKHVLPNVAIPFLSLAGIQLGYLLGGSIILEQIFSVPGLGQLLVTAVFNGDYPIIQAVVVILSLMFFTTVTIVRLISHILYTLART